MFFIVILLINVLMPFQIFYRWLNVAFSFGPYAIWIKLLLLLLTTGPMAYFYTAHNSIPIGWVKVTSLLFAVLTLLFFASIVYELIKPLMSFMPMSWHFALNLSYGLLVIVYIITSITLAFLEPRINRVEIGLSGFKGTPYKMAVLADMHVGPLLRESFTKRVVELVNQESPEIVLIVGDLSDHKPPESAPVLLPLKDLKARDGVFFSLGNHEYYRGNIPLLVDLLKSYGIRSLLNESVYIGDDSRGFNLAGMNDLTGLDLNYMKPDYVAIKKSLRPDRPTVLMSHRPKSYRLTDEAIDLQLSGHTHGGQIFPFHLFTYIGNAFHLYGLHQIDSKRKMFITRGTGFWGPPMRLFAPQEVTIISIKNLDSTNP